jgi:hypothetical protein
LGPNTFSSNVNGITFNEKPKLLSSLTDFEDSDLVPKSYVDSVSGGGGGGGIEGIVIEGSNIAIGQDAYISEDYVNSISIGTGAEANTNNCIAIGKYTSASYYSNTIVMGNGTSQQNKLQATAENSIRIGNNDVKTVQLGKCMNINENNFSVAVGSDSSAQTYGVAIGYYASAGDTGNIVIGYSTNTSTYSKCIAIGNYVNSTSNNQILIGNDDITSIVLGPLSISFSGDNVVFTKDGKSKSILLE